MKTPIQIRKDLRKSYSEIARDFHHTRSHAWPEFGVFSEYIPDGSKVLDLGCGNGRLLAYLSEKAKRKIDYTGVDFCPELLDFARNRFPKQDFEEQDITELDLGRRFDVITAVASFHHISSRKVRQQTLTRISRHLEEDGLFLLSVWNLWQWKYISAHFKAWLRWVTSFFRSDPRDLMIPFGKKKIKRYYHAFLPSELRRALKRSRFRVIRWEVSGFNYVAVCQKRSSVAPSNPVPIYEKKLRHTLNTPSTVASCKCSS